MSASEGRYYICNNLLEGRFLCVRVFLQVNGDDINAMFIGIFLKNNMGYLSKVITTKYLLHVIRIT